MCECAFERGAKLRLIILSRNSLTVVLNLRLASQPAEVHGGKTGFGEKIQLFEGFMLQERLIGNLYTQ